MDSRFEGACRLPHLGVIRATGEDAATFLHSQLTQDFALLPPGQARLAAFCNAKGRMLASFVGFAHAPGDVLLVTSADLLAPTLKRLSMFILRAKVKLSDASSEFGVWGLAGPAAGPAGAAPWSLSQEAGFARVRLYPAEGVARSLAVGPVDAQPAAASLDPAHWSWLDVRSGVATLGAAVSEAFVPQMLNYESVGGVNFKKGCYPGQEVVARSQFRGTLKRRAYLVHADSPLQAGQDIFQSDDLEQPCGTVAQAAAAPGGGTDAIVSMQVSAAESGRITTGPGGAPLTLLPLPYPLLADV